MVLAYLILFLLVGILLPTAYAQISDEPDILIQKAKDFLYAKQYENAIIELNKILEGDPDNIYALNEKGNIRLIQGKFVKALQNFDKSLQFEPKNIVALN